MFIGSESTFGRVAGVAAAAAELVDQAARRRRYICLDAMTREQALAELAKRPLPEQRAIVEQARLLQVQRQHEQRFTLWQEQLRRYVRAERGRTSDLARYLGVRRQSVWRWINEPWSKFPAWAAVATIVWYFRRSPAQAIAVSGSVVTPALQLVSPQEDKP